MSVHRAWAKALEVGGKSRITKRLPCDARLVHGGERSGVSVVSGADDLAGAARAEWKYGAVAALPREEQAGIRARPRSLGGWGAADGRQWPPMAARAVGARGARPGGLSGEGVRAATAATRP